MKTIPSPAQCIAIEAVAELILRHSNTHGSEPSLILCHSSFLSCFDLEEMACKISIWGVRIMTKDTLPEMSILAVV